MSKLAKLAQKLPAVPWNDVLCVVVPLSLMWPAMKLGVLVIEGKLEESQERSRRREQYVDEARIAWANGVDLDQVRGSFWKSLFDDNL